MTGTACDTIDFNTDVSVVDPIDIDGFLNVYREGDCISSEAMCNDIDFNNDGAVPSDHADTFRVWPWSLRPKNNVPFLCEPVIADATADRERQVSPLYSKPSLRQNTL